MSLSRNAAPRNTFHEPPMTPMRSIQSVTLYRLKVPLHVPYRLVFGPVEHFDTVIAEVVDDDGNAGFGEATILTGYTDETIDGSWLAAKQFAATLGDTDDSPRHRIAALGAAFPF